MSTDNQQGRLKNLNDINPWYITGFTEGEGTFHIAIYFDKQTRYGIKLIPEFHVNQSYLRIETLRTIKNYFNCGYIKENHAKNANDTTYVYVVRNRNDLIKKIIPFFEQYALISRKNETFRIFKKIVEEMREGIHKNKNGIRKLIHLAYQMNEKGKNRRIPLKKILDFLEPSETVRKT